MRDVGTATLSLFLQVTTSNACEAWHGKLKGGGGLKKGDCRKHSICGMMMQITQMGHDVDYKARKAATDFRSTKLAVCTKLYPVIRRLPVPVQKLIASVLEGVQTRIAQDKLVPYFQEHLVCL